MDYIVIDDPIKDTLPKSAAEEARYNRAVAWWWKSTGRGSAIIRSLEEQGILPAPHTSPSSRCQ